jgi:aldehyde dehydrogenase (NAD+)
LTKIEGEERGMTSISQVHDTTRAWSDLRLLIGGASERGRGPVLEVVDPATEATVTSVAGADTRQIDAAVSAARRAFDEGPWSRCGGAARASAIRSLADAVERRFEQLVEAIVTEAGSPVTLSRFLQVSIPLTHLRAYADAALRPTFEDLGQHDDPVPSRSTVSYRPIGVVAAITAYNYPLILAVHKVGAALAAGCSVVLMPSPQTPIATLLFAEAVAESDLPPGVVNVVAGTATEAKVLTEHPGVDKISFTGSPSVGEMVMTQAARGLRPVVLELGGKSPALLLPDADFERVLPDLHRRYSRNAGQGCASPTRLLVPAERWDDFVELTRAAVSEIPVGDPWDPATLCGPLISDAHRRRVEGYVTEAVSAGGTVIAGGGRPNLPKGFYMNPTVVAEVEADWRICQEEIFGPVAVALRYKSLDEAVNLANSTRYGLHAYIFSGDVDLARELAGRLRAGTVTINGGGGLRPDAPMTGWGISGIGSEIGRWGINEYLLPQHVQWATPAG